MLKLNNINLEQNPELIQPPQVDDNIVIIKLVADTQEIIKADIIDVALSYSIAGIDVILEIVFADRDKFNKEHLASLICNGGWSLSLLAPELELAQTPITKHNKKYHKQHNKKYHKQHNTKSNNKSNKQHDNKSNKKHNTKSNQQLRLKDYRAYAQHIITWYELWRSQTMINFDKVIYPITPYLEYLTTHYLIDNNKKDLKATDIKALIELSKNPTDTYLLGLIENVQTDVADEFKKQLKDFIQKHDRDFYHDIDLLTNQVTKAKCQT